MSARKKLKLTDKEEKSGSSSDQNQVVPAEPSNEEPTPDIFRLTCDCFDEIFEYLTLEELNSFGKTCKAMQKVAGEYFKQNYSAAKIGGGSNGIFADISKENHIKTENMLDFIEIIGFEQFITSMNIDSVISSFRYNEPHINQFVSVNQISVENTNIREKFMRKILRQVETVRIGNGCRCISLYDIMLKFCGKLKRLYVKKSDLDCYQYDRYGQEKWLMQIYSNLEHFEYIPPLGSLALDELYTFLEFNKKIHTFGTSADCLWMNRHEFKISEAKLDILEVKCARKFGNDEPTLQSMCELINQLYEQGFYKKLHLYVQKVDEEFNTQVVSLNGLEKLCIKYFYGNLPPLTDLKELAILDYYHDMDAPGGNGMEILANDLVNLQRLYMYNAKSIDDIMPFIRRSRKLNKIKIFFKNECRFKVFTLNLLKLNKEREKLSEARKVMIYASENTFLITKWTTKNGDTNLKLIELRRAESYEWNQYFD